MNSFRSRGSVGLHARADPAAGAVGRARHGGAALGGRRPAPARRAAPPRRRAARHAVAAAAHHRARAAAGPPPARYRLRLLFTYLLPFQYLYR